MPHPAEDQIHEAKRGAAVVAACIVRTLEDADPGFRERFLGRLGEAYGKLKDMPSQGDKLDALEVVAWTRSLLTGFDMIEGQGEPFFWDEP